MARPPVVIPDALCATEAEIFRPVEPASVPEIADVLAHLAEHEPEVLAAVGDVDRSLLWPEEGMSAFAHARACARLMAQMSTFAEGATRIPADTSAA